MKTDPNIYKKNMEALMQRYPDLALMLNLVKIEKYQLFQHENCIPNVMVNGVPYYVGNMMKYCEEQFRGFKCSNAKIPIFCGAGLFYEVLYWLQFKAKEHQTQAVMIFEKDLELFQCAMNVTDLTPLLNNPQIHFFVGIPLDQLYIKLR
ncbi:MAG: hypothetical protein WC769_13020, partial [Thermodesulfovibrionales bacterium]